jgi:hypothetical protein
LYRLNVLDEARAEIAALPQQILPALAEAMAVLEAAPWSGEPQNESNPDGPYAVCCSVPQVPARLSICSSTAITWSKSS